VTAEQPNGTGRIVRMHLEEAPMAFGWKLYEGGKTPPVGAAVAPDERLSWPRTIGIGAQHVVAMFGATFVFPIVMGLDPNLAIMMSGVATVIFLLVVNNKIPSYLGTSASFVGGVAAIRAQGGNSSDVVGSILISGAVLAVIGLIIHVAGARVVNRVLPPAITGAVVMLIGFNLAPVVATIYWPQDQWVALLTMAFVLICSVVLRGFWARISILLGLVFGYVLSWVFDKAFGQIHSITGSSNGKQLDHFRTDFSGVKAADWIGFPHLTAPHFSATFTLLVLPAVIALIAENAGHVKAVSAMTKRDLDPMLGRAIFADGLGTVVATSIGGSPTTTYAENIGVMAATRVYSTAAYYVAAVVAILLGLCPKFGALVAATPGGVLGGITVILYGMIGLLGAKIWKENRVDFANPINLVPLAAGIIIAIGGVALQFSANYSLSGIALGTIVAVVGWHLARVLAPQEMRDALRAEGGYYGGTGPAIGEFGLHEVGETGADAEEFGTPSGHAGNVPGARTGAEGRHATREGSLDR
jgi:uracil-xanthine permease